MPKINHRDDFDSLNTRFNGLTHKIAKYFLFVLNVCFLGCSHILLSHSIDVVYYTRFEYLRRLVGCCVFSVSAKVDAIRSTQNKFVLPTKPTICIKHIRLNVDNKRKQPNSSILSVRIQIDSAFQYSFHTRAGTDKLKILSIDAFINVN